jgi:hypothetical protein
MGIPSWLGWLLIAVSAVPAVRLVVAIRRGRTFSIWWLLVAILWIGSGVAAGVTLLLRMRLFYLFLAAINFFGVLLLSGWFFMRTYRATASEGSK